MHVFLTGATGFIGGALTLRLRRAGHTVSAWVRSPDRAREALGGQATLVDAAGGEASLRAAVATADAVVNLAGEPIVGRRWSDERRRRLVASRVDLTDQIAAALGDTGGGRVLVSASAIGYYGDRGAEVLEEPSGGGDDFLATLCQRWEEAARGAEAHGTRVVTPRIGIVLGAGGGALQTMLPLFRAGLGGRLGSGRQYMSWIHLHDLVEILAQSIEDPALRGPVNAVAPNPVDNRTFTRALGAALGRPTWLPAPSIALRAVFGDASQALLGSQRVLPRALEEVGFDFAFPTVDAALADILRPSGGPTNRPVDRASVPGGAYLDARPPRRELRASQVVAAPLEAVFDFFSRAENLSVMTPPWMDFRIQTPLPIAMEEGAVIDYRIALGPIPMTWRTVIEAWEVGGRFVDSQARGPYGSWWHEHRFEAVDAGHTRIEDRVLYAAPLGPLGRIADWLFIRRTLARIFAYRVERVRLRFGVPA